MDTIKIKIFIIDGRKFKANYGLSSITLHANWYEIRWLTCSWKCIRNCK